MHCTKAMILWRLLGSEQRQLDQTLLGTRQVAYLLGIPPARNLGSYRMSIPCGHVVATIDGHVTSVSNLLQDFSIHRAS